MANIPRNLTETERLARRIAQSDLNFPKETFRQSDWEGYEFLDEVGATTDAGMPEAMATVEGPFLGIPFAICCLVALLLILISALLTVTYNSCNPTPTGLGKIVDPLSDQPAGPSQHVGDGRTYISPPNVPYISEDPRTPHFSADPNVPSIVAPGKTGDWQWEARLQRERLAVIARGDTSEYNRLIGRHRELYALRGVDPCKSGFFPQGCDVQQ